MPKILRKQRKRKEPPKPKAERLLGKKWIPFNAKNPKARVVERALSKASVVAFKRQRVFLVSSMEELKQVFKANFPETSLARNLGVGLGKGTIDAKLAERGFTSKDFDFVLPKNRKGTHLVLFVGRNCLFLKEQLLHETGRALREFEQKIDAETGRQWGVRGTVERMLKKKGLK